MLVQQDVEKEIKANHPRAAIITHFFGNIVDISATCGCMDETFLIEDGGQALGAFYDDRPVGSYSDVGSFACSNKKLVTAGQGGLNVCDDERLNEAMRVYSHHGKNSDGNEVIPGYNFRGGEMEAVLASHALSDIKERVTSRNAAARIFQDRFDQAGIKYAVPFSEVDCKPAWFDIPVILDKEWGGYRDELLKALVAEGVPAWKYSSLICTPWIRAYMSYHGWWDDATEALMEREKKLWDRVFVIGTQFTEDEATILADRIVGVLTGK
ncbi:degT/dnrJ/eryC1/strS aminotransferase [Bombiscardovia coagulans]|uniref:DegT/dnrJ/eryC1/strS aminotransferase n=1 Tax=Bombiscardovia coagulans TaxID=686666 RepID=A0A261EW09_9BIFI|nr:degT/dnrJ/eryC1/strS aminotransferase [Bombiscardovia coagulans]